MKLVESLQGKAFKRPPLWIMRQAGRYLPEFRSLRQKVPQFLEFCAHPNLAAEVTLQPIERFNLDAAIIFSDILVVPHALGQKVHFAPEEGPVLEALSSEKDLDRLFPKISQEHIEPTLEALRLVRKELDPSKTLIGFAGAPWTVMTYMLEGGGSKGKGHLHSLSCYLENTPFFEALLERVIEATQIYLLEQVKAGAQVLKIFDSWASSVPFPLQEALVLTPLKRIAATLKERHPEIPLILFPKGLPHSFLARFQKEISFDGLACDASEDPNLVAQTLGVSSCIQTGPNPAFLKVGGEFLEDEVKRYLDAFDGRPYIFNLAHGISKDTPPDNLKRMIDFIDEYTDKRA